MQKINKNKKSDGSLTFINLLMKKGAQSFLFY